MTEKDNNRIEERYIAAIHKLARDTGLSVEDFSDIGSPERICVHLGVTGADNFWVPCDLQLQKVVDWVDNGSNEGKTHITSCIELAKNKLRQHYRNSG